LREAEPLFGKRFQPLEVPEVGLEVPEVGLEVPLVGHICHHEKNYSHASGWLKKWALKLILSTD
jgi:hypothetical protein